MNMDPGPRTYKKASLRIAIAEGLPADMWETTREIVGVQSENKRGGEATALMWQTIAEADQAWLTLIVHPLKFADGLPDEKLAPWYEKFGFVKIQEEPCLMARSPQKPVIARLH